MDIKLIKIAIESLKKTMGPSMTPKEADAIVGIVIRLLEESIKNT